MSTDSIISKVWGFCTTLRDDGVGYGDYLEQLTCLRTGSGYNSVTKSNALIVARTMTTHISHRAAASLAK